MIRICFVCLGNICRSPMAEFIMKNKVKSIGVEEDFFIASRATSYEEEGNDMYPLAKRMLEKHKIPYTLHHATRLEKDDYDKFDYFITMEDANNRGIQLIFEDREHKVHKLLSKDIADPWYSGNFQKTYEDLNCGIDFLIKELT